MKNFNYYCAKDSKEASKLSTTNSAFLAGGMTTIPSMKLGLATYKDIIDIKRIKEFSATGTISSFMPTNPELRALIYYNSVLLTSPFMGVSDMHRIRNLIGLLF